MADKYIYMCPQCKSVYSDYMQDFIACPDCRVKLISTGYRLDKWKSKSKEEKAELKLQFENTNKKEIEMQNQKRRDMSNMLITSGFNFDGYHITKYSGYISGDDAIQVERGMASIFSTGTNVRNALMESLVVIRRNALQELKEAAYDLGCNAVIGVDFDYITLDPQTANLSGGTTYQPYIFGVTANGNAVIIEKDDPAMYQGCPLYKQHQSLQMQGQHQNIQVQTFGQVNQNGGQSVSNINHSTSPNSFSDVKLQTNEYTENTLEREKRWDDDWNKPV